LEKPKRKTLTHELIQQQIQENPTEHQEYLYKAFQRGHLWTAKNLLEMGADPHKKNEHGLTPALLPFLCGHTELQHLAPINKDKKDEDYEEDYIVLKTLSQWCKLNGQVTLHEQKVRLEATYSNWLFQKLAECLTGFQNWDRFSELTIHREKVQEIQKALEFAYVEHSYQKIADKIQKNEPCFVNSGWKGHAVCFAFYKGQMAIGNRGENIEGKSTLVVYDIDPSKVTASLVEEILACQFADKEIGQKIIYEKIPKQIALRQDTSYEKIAPKFSRDENCALNSKKAALRFIWAKMLENDQNLKHLELARRETKIFTGWAAAKYIIHNYDLNRFQGPNHREKIYEPIALAFNDKKERFDLYMHTIES